MVFLTNSNDATKVRYYTPNFGDFSFGVSYTPTQSDIDSGANNGDNIACKDGDQAMEAENIVEGGLVYNGDSRRGILASVVGLYGELINDGEETFGDDKWYGVQAGATIDLFGFKLAGSFGTTSVGEHPDATSSPPASVSRWGR